MPHQDSSPAQSCCNCAHIAPWEAGQHEVCLRGRHLKTHLPQSLFGHRAYAFYPRDVAMHPRDVSQSSGAGADGEAVQIVRILDLKEVLDHWRLRETKPKTHSGE